MAVVQISRIQVRRGKINSGTGLPQLASGEMAWAIDSQELYIGNGAVSEGAPAVGNTKIITANDLAVTGNIYNIIQYVYKSTDATIQTGANANTPVVQTIQTVLDKQADTTDFGAKGDWDTSLNIGTDDTQALQRAINQLFLNSSGKASADSVAGISKRTILKMPPGQFKITSPIYIPSYTSLVGSGAEKTIIYYNPTSTIIGTTTLNSTVIQTVQGTSSMVGANISGSGIPTSATVVSVIVGTSITISAAATSINTSTSLQVILSLPAIQFVNSDSTAGNPSSLGSTLGTTQPRNIVIKDLTIHTSTGLNTCLQLDAVKDSLFENVNLQGDWSQSYNALSCGITMNAVSALVTCEHNIFRNVVFNAFSYGVFAKYDIRNNVFDNCLFNDAWQGISLGAGANGGSTGQQYGPRETSIVNCKFYNIRRQAVDVELGSGNTTRDCKYINVGNNGGGNLTAQYPQVYFNSYGNTSQNDYSDRAGDLSTNNLTTQYVPEVAGHGTYYLQGTRSISIGYVTSSATLGFRLPCSTSLVGTPTGSIVYKIEYIYKSTANAFTRRGTITVSADVDSKQIQLSDDYDFAGNDPTGATAIILDFKAYFLDASSNIYTGSISQTITSIGLWYTNNLNGDTGTFSYSYTASL
jgi:hypothetical protein